MSEENKKETAPKAVETPKVEEVVVAETPVTEEVEAAPVLEEVKAEKSPKKKVEKVEEFDWDKAAQNDMYSTKERTDLEKEYSST